jgi:hypothetical protein
MDTKDIIFVSIVSIHFSVFTTLICIDYFYSMGWGFVR